MAGVCVILYKVMNELVDGGINRGSFEDDFNNSIYFSKYRINSCGFNAAG